MNHSLLPILAAIGCAFCNGIAAVLQKISADKEKPADGLSTGLLLRLARDKPYVIGVLLDLAGWGLTLYAVQYLPLFFVEAVIAASIMITAVVERVFRGQSLSRRSYASILLILVGLVLLAFAASPEKAHHVGDLLKWLIVLMPVPIGVAGYAVVRRSTFGSAVGLAALAGLAFGGTSVIGRIFTVWHPLWHTVYDPLIAALIATGTLGIMLFSIALQRAQATIINAAMTVSQTVIPAAIGIACLGDHARHGLWYLVMLGTTLALAGVASLAARPQA